MIIPLYRKIFGAAAVILLLAGCASEIGVTGTDFAGRKIYGSLSEGSDILSPDSVNFIGNFLLQELYKDDPAALVSRLEQLYHQENRPETVFTMADCALQLGYRFADEPDKSASYYLLAAFAANYYLTVHDSRTDLYSNQRIRMIQVGNWAATELFIYLKQRSLERKGGFELRLPGNRKVKFSVPQYDLPVPVEAVADFSACADYKTENLTHVSRTFGIGVPLVATLKNGTADIGGNFADGTPLAVTAVLDFSPAVKRFDGIKAVLRYVYSRTADRVKIGDREFPLAADFSTPLAKAVSVPGGIHHIARMLFTEKAAPYTGLYHLEPYDDKLIPVIFVHGLMSDARTWSQMLNTLLNDAALRKKYQFMGFSYSSGNPVFLSSMLLRKSLQAMREELVKRKLSTDSFDQMVLVGHSMGGLLSRMQISSCNMDILEKHFPEEVIGVLKKKIHDPAYRPIVEFKPCRFVKRVIFIAVPHRGSEIAGSFIGRIGEALIKLPVELVKTNMELAAELISRKKTVKGGRVLQTGIGNLRPDDPGLRLINALPIAPGVVYHSIIGNREKQGVPGGSDGVVPYKSSHLDGAVSELVVKSGHSAHRNPLAIQEVRSILLEHIRCMEKEQKK